jgi:phosphate-selective porin OprO and OprP
MCRFRNKKGAGLATNRNINKKTHPRNLMRKHIPASVAMLATTGLAFAETDALTAKFDDAWSLVKLYENKENPILQKLAFTGRAQLDYALIDGEGSPTAGFTDSDLDYEFGGWRRLRAGFKATMFQDFTLHAEADFDPDEAPVYSRITDAYIAWSPSDAFEIKVGKQGIGYTLDGATSSKELITIDRNNLSNNLWFTGEYIPGITIGGTHSNWIYNFGVFSQGGQDNEFGDFDQGTAWLASLGYDFSKAMGAEEAVVRLDYVFNEETTATDMFTNRNLGNIVSLNGSYENGDFGVRGDLSYGEGFLGQPDVFGLVVMPYYNITEKLQAVFRYTYLHSDGNDGIRYGRYETTPLNGRRGDEYQEAYAGLNYYFYGHKLKLQTGVQYVSMNDDANNGGAFDGFAWTTGLRLSW